MEEKEEENYEEEEEEGEEEMEEMEQLKLFSKKYTTILQVSQISESIMRRRWGGGGKGRGRGGGGGGGRKDLGTVSCCPL